MIHMLNKGTSEADIFAMAGLKPTDEKRIQQLNDTYGKVVESGTVAVPKYNKMICTVCNQPVKREVFQEIEKVNGKTWVIGGSDKVEYSCGCGIWSKVEV